MALFLTVGFVVGSMKPRFYRNNVFVEIIFLAIALLLYEILYAILLWQFSIGVFFLNIIRFGIPRVFYSIAISLILFPLLRRIPHFSENN